MNIAWVHNRWFPYSDEKPYTLSAGGAALTNVLLIQEGKRRGHAIDLIFAYERDGTPNQDCIDYLTYDLDRADLFIIHHIPRFSPVWLKRIMNHKPFVRHDHAYDFCSSGVSRMSPHCFARETQCAGCGVNLPRQLIRRSILNVFQSPLHKDTYLRILNVEAGNSFILTPPIDTDLFKPDPQIERDPNLTLCVGSILHHKGVYEIMTNHIDANPGMTYRFIGGGKEDVVAELRKRKNVVLEGSVANHKLPAHYALAKYYIHLPKWFEPSSRSTMEAKLMGCECIMNDRVGTISFPWIDSGVEVIRDRVSHAAEEYWEAVEKAYEAGAQPKSISHLLRQKAGLWRLSLPFVRNESRAQAHSSETVARSSSRCVRGKRCSDCMTAPLCSGRYVSEYSRGSRYLKCSSRFHWAGSQYTAAA
jgi:glycosyltransferase involved in cell wall biosynthesis